MMPNSVAAAPADATEQIPFVRLDQAEPELFAELLEAVERIARDGAFTLGEEVERFERAFASWCETEHAVGVSSGTSALELALRAAGVGPGDEVVVPSNSFIATAEAVTASGAVPRFVDVEERTALLTAEIVQQALTPRTRCVIPVHLYGRTVDMDPLLRLCRAHGVSVVEDACQAHGARYRGRPVGTLGDAGCFSFYPTKNLGAWGDGGAVVTADGALADQVRLLRSHGEARRHDHEVAAGTHRLHGLQAGILRVKLNRLDGWNESRRVAARALCDALDARRRGPCRAARRLRPRLPSVRRPHPGSGRPPYASRLPRGFQRDPLPDADSPAARVCRASSENRPPPNRRATGGGELLAADIPGDHRAGAGADRRRCIELRRGPLSRSEPPEIPPGCRGGRPPSGGNGGHHVMGEPLDHVALGLVGEAGEQRQEDDVLRGRLRVREIGLRLGVGALQVDRHDSSPRRDTVLQQQAHQLERVHRSLRIDSNRI